MYFAGCGCNNNVWWQRGKTTQKQLFHVQKTRKHFEGGSNASLIRDEVKKRK